MESGTTFLTLKDVVGQVRSSGVAWAAYLILRSSSPGRLPHFFGNDGRHGRQNPFLRWIWFLGVLPCVAVVPASVEFLADEVGDRLLRPAESGTQFCRDASCIETNLF